MKEILKAIYKETKRNNFILASHLNIKLNWYLQRKDNIWSYILLEKENWECGFLINQKGE